jgi:Immunoglobulin I-set domain
VEYKPEFFLGTNRQTIKKKVKHGTDFELNCDSHENLNGTVKWTYSVDGKKNKRQLDNDAKILSLHKMNSSMDGIYECVISNSVGSSSKFFAVKNSPHGKIDFYQQSIVFF